MLLQLLATLAFSRQLLNGSRILALQLEQTEQLLIELIASHALLVVLVSHLILGTLHAIHNGLELLDEILPPVGTEHALVVGLTDGIEQRQLLLQVALLVVECVVQCIILLSF